jgi:hypothetical protein
MSVLTFERKQDGELWSETELHTILTTLNTALGAEHGRGWETGMTEKGDPQFYLLGPLPDQVCQLCVSRIGGRYILEDGAGQLLFEHQSLPLVTLHAKAAVSARQWSLVARITLLWVTVRHTLHDKVEPLLVESEEIFFHLAPKLAAFA